MQLVSPDNFDGKIFPSLMDWVEMSATIHPEDHDQFLMFHNKTMRKLRQSFESAHEQGRLEQAICERVGLSFPKLMRAFFVQAYFRDLFSGFLANPRSSYELTLPRPEKLLSKLRPSVKQMDERLNQLFTSYRESHFIVGAFSKALGMGASGSDPVLRALVREYGLLWKSEALADHQAWETLPKDEGVTTLCQFCGKLILFGRGQGITKAPPHCDEPSCEKAYNRKRQASVRAKQKPADEWVAAFEKRRDCKGCGMRRKVNLDGLCKVCFSCDTKGPLPG